jgi:hypothetical protein
MQVMQQAKVNQKSDGRHVMPTSQGLQLQNEVRCYSPNKLISIVYYNANK